MKKIIALVLALLIVLISVSALGEESPRLITVSEWLDEKGPDNSALVVKVVSILNPVLAAVGDETGMVNLFGILKDGEFSPLDAADIQAGDILILQDPKYNEYEGTVEMAEAVLLRKIRLEEGPVRFLAAEYEITASPDEPIFINSQIFEGDVTVSGEGQPVHFNDCEFHGNLICLSPAQTVVWIWDDCDFADGAHCVLKSGVREATMDYSLPKFGLYAPVEVECEDLGGVIAVGAFDLCLNGQIVTPQNPMLYEQSSGEIVPYEEGMEVNTFVICRWWENGEETILTVGAP